MTGATQYQAGPTVIAVMIVTAVCLYREGLARLLGGRSGIEVTAAAAPGEDVLVFAAKARPQVVLVDSATARASAIVQRLIATGTGAKVLAFGVAEEDEEDVLSCLEAGVSGFVTESATPEELVAAIRGAVRGEVWSSPRISALVARRVASLAVRQDVRPAQPRLTPREAQVMGLIDAGLSNKQIATSLGVEIATVKTHVHNILDKLRLHRRAEAAAFLRTLRY